MGSKWEQALLGELIAAGDAVLQTGPFGTALKAEEYTETGVPLISVREIREGFIQLEDITPRVDSAVTARLPKFVLQEGDIVFARKGGVERNALITEREKGWFVGSDGIYLRLSKKYDAKYFSYVMRSPQVKAWLLKNCEGTTMPSLNQKILARVPIFLPSKIQQEKIADLLFQYDEKITINNQINQTLEKMAQTLFKSWFVDFDPVKAKMNGEQPKGMDTATASLFPEKLVESELGLIPEGWDAVQVGDIVQRLKPKKRYTKKQVEPYGKTPVYEQGASILLGFHNDDAGFDASPEDPVFIFGDHTCITHLSCSKFDISSNVIPLKGSVRPTIWTYYAIQGKQEFQEYRRHWSEFIIKDVVLPPVELAEKYAELVTTKYLMMESLKRQSKELEQLRDTLLPKLLSGEIDLESVQVEQVKELAE
ncbi:restriction endonuclease subunit S [Vibrio splendidus]|jgi:type I restriction enzyme, S subunit|uniref:restriction endonuclease subunit S n=1 Tax=Vibrio splendidus TaxID=29497 RepID=UPI000D3A6B27|nr:restriction endonuclease subunit S [Vibrio splendidus]PTO66155.1 restriction endonuclease subunit S [Vibrio splendidus]PTO91884.1 restriction endonuclease subunit S [Vibrio splendidus]